MTSTVHTGHANILGKDLGAKLSIERGRVTLEISCSGEIFAMPDRISLVKFISNTGYFTAVNLFRKNYNMRLGLAGLATYTGGLVFESAHFDSVDEISTNR